MADFYVYLHTDPDTKEVVYVGKGRNGRAWDVTRSRNQHHKHQAWMKELCNKGYLPCDWVTILHRSLTEEQAFAMEKDYLHTNGVLKFCRQSGERQHQAKLTDAQAVEAYILVKQKGWSHKAVAEKYGVSRSAISMLVTGKQWKATTARLRNEND